mmetsp:Transcript_26871/g.64481  ORF Transcript_26871/g.64481 Transcript_26871/m.64481 type:complete len:254 (+) Transcript_26871:3540-4301(+)
MSALSNIKGRRPCECARLAPVASTFSVSARISARRHQKAIVALRVEEGGDTSAVTRAVLPTITILSTSGSFAPRFSGNVAGPPSPGGNGALGSASRSIASPTQHSGGCEGSLKFLGELPEPNDPDDTALFHELLGCIAGCRVMPGRPDDDDAGALVMLSRFLGVERSWTLAHGAATSSFGVDGGVIRGFFRGDTTFRNFIAVVLLPVVLFDTLPPSPPSGGCWRALTGDSTGNVKTPPPPPPWLPSSTSTINL